MTPRALGAAAVALAVVAAACAPTIDEPVARWLGDREVWSGWDAGVRGLEYAGGIEPWVWTSVVVLGAGAIATLAVPRWRGASAAWLVVLGTHALSRNVVSWTKLVTGRLRPVEWLATGGDAWLRDGGFSFPSGHVAWFASLAVPIAVLVPRARVPLAIVIAFVMIARVAVGAHFISDTVAALALECACTALWLHVTRRLRAGSPPPASPR
jgi:membrane-associated phospholipid phosphatase|nr:phosphatase PAP2 family protein [Kofleriaceae bacterium]